MSQEYREMTVVELREMIQRQAVERENFFREYYRKTEESRKDAEESRKRIENMELKLQKLKEDYERRSKEIQEEIGYAGNVQGQIAEDTFRRTLRSLLGGIGIQIDRVLHRLTYSNGVEHFEYDLVAVNGTGIFVFEIKNKLRSKDISKFTEHQLPRFKSLFPEFEHLTLYGGFGTLVIGEEMERQVLQQGLYLLTHSDECGAKLHVPI